MQLWQPSLPEHYLRMTEDDLFAAIEARRRELGDDLLILGHHYQQDEVIAHADLTGDSLKLSQMAAEESAKRGTKYIVFCGVHFMAETADMLTDESVRVILPDLSAGCSMADMADYDDVVDAWQRIHEVLDEKPNLTTNGKRKSLLSPSPLGRGVRGEGRTGKRACSSSKGTVEPRVIPITYVNSSAAVKAFVGAHGGACCTSSNATQIFKWAIEGGTQPVADDEDIKLFFLPDQHLGRNTASKFGYLTEVDEAAGRGESECALWNPRKDNGGLTDEQIRKAKVLLWAGHCSVHKLFRPEHVDQAREQFADKGGVTVLVHPECCKEVVDKADFSGSTEFIIKQILAAGPGANWAVGTETHLVNRLAREARERGGEGGGVNVFMLSECHCLCTTMFRIDQQHLLWALDNLASGKIVNEIRVKREVASDARLALDRMLAHVGQPKPQAEAALVD